MKKKISIQYSSLRIPSRRMIFVFVILLFVSQSILHAQIQTGSISFDGRLRNYMVYLPDNYTGSTNFPLVIYLHSYGWTAQRGMDYTQLNQVADASDFIVVYPSAVPNWNSVIGDNPGTQLPNVDDVGFINALIDIMSNRYSIDLERVYACGYSNGGMMSYKLALQLSHRIAAIASVGGTIATYTPESPNPVRPIPVLEIHGTSDTWVPINGKADRLSVDQTLSIWTSFNDCVQVDTTILPDLDPTDGCTVEKINYTNCSDNCNVVYYKVIDGGHSWPGAGPAGYAVGNTNQDINAGVEIWNFFKNHKLIIPPVVDFNGDGIVDGADICMMIEYWHTDEPFYDIAPPPSGDGIVDVQDLIVLAEHLFTYPGAVAYWKLDETEGEIAYDSVGVYYGILNGVPTWQPTSGIIDGAIQLDGVDDCIISDSVLNPTAGPFSVFAWIKGGVPGQVILSQESGVNWLMADAVDGALKTDLRTPAEPGHRIPLPAGPPLISPTVVTDGDWHRVGFVRDGSDRILYVDDIEVARDTATNLEPASGGLYIGAGSDLEPGAFWSGLIDDVRIYDRVVIPMESCDTSREVRVNVDDAGIQVELEQGQILVVTLESNPTTGYRWEVAETQESILEQMGEAEFKPSQTGEPPVPGAGGWEIFRFKAISAGQMTLQLVYRRSWEEGVEPINTFSLQVVVR